MVEVEVGVNYKLGLNDSETDLPLGSQLKLIFDNF